MTNLLKQKLIQKYPRIFPKKILDDSLFDISCQDGWYQIIDDLCAQIQAKVDAAPDQIRQVTIPYIKEKFAMLSLSFSGGDDSIVGLISAAMDRSMHTCELCGSTENAQVSKKRSFFKTLCQPCRIIENYISVDRENYEVLQ